MNIYFLMLIVIIVIVVGYLSYGIGYSDSCSDEKNQKSFEKLKRLKRERQRGFDDGV
jgi:hypothetical protein